MPADLAGWARFVAAVTFRPQHTAADALRTAADLSARLLRVTADRDAAWERLREERELCDQYAAQSKAYWHALRAIRDAAPTASTVYRLADAALKGEGTDD